MTYFAKTIATRVSRRHEYRAGAVYKRSAEIPAGIRFRVASGNGDERAGMSVYGWTGIRQSHCSFPDT